MRVDHVDYDVNVYTFDELNPVAQEKAISNFCDINTDYEWWNDILEQFCTSLEKECGFSVEVKDIEFVLQDRRENLSVMNGRIHIDSDKIWENNKEDFKELYEKHQSEELDFSIWVNDYAKGKKSGYYYSEFPREGHFSTSDNFDNIFSVDLDIPDQDIDEDEDEEKQKLKEKEKEAQLKSIKDMCANEYGTFVEKLSGLFKTLNTDMSERSSSDQIIESIKANEYEFLEDGSTYN